MSDLGCVLVLEDEVVIAINIAAELEDAGWRVAGPVGTVQRALALLDTGGVTIAVLDVNLGQDHSYPVADRLRADGIPFVFLSGDGARDLPERFVGDTILGKPIRFERLLAALEGLMLPSVGPVAS